MSGHEDLQEFTKEREERISEVKEAYKAKEEEMKNKVNFMEVDWSDMAKQVAEMKEAFNVINTMGYVQGGRTYSDVTARTQRDADRALDTTFSTTRENSDIGVEEAWASNVKRTYDVHQSWDMELARRSAAHFDAEMTAERMHKANVRKLELEAMQNGTHNANLANTQSLAHRDIAVDRTWNVDEVATLTAKSGVQADAIIAALAVAVAKVLAAKKD